MNVPRIPALVLTAALAAWSAAAAQPSMVLVEACNAIPDAAKRLQCLRTAIAQTRAADSREDAIVHAFMALQWRIDAGITLADYQAMLPRLARELATYAAQAPANRRPGIARLEKAMETYRDAAAFWEAATQFYARRENAIAYFGGVPMDQVGLAWMVSKHQLPTRRADLLGFHEGVPAAAGRAAMWLKAQQLTAEGVALLRDPPWGPPEYDALRAAAEQSVRTQMLPEPAPAFRNLFASRSPEGGARTVCGEVRGVLHDGTEVDYLRFYSQGNAVAMGIERPDWPGFALEWAARCAHRAYTFG